MIRKIKRILFILGISLILVYPHVSVIAATDLDIGAPCNSNSECQSGDCEGSQKKDPSGNSLSFCDCDDDADCNQKWGPPTTGAWECSDGADYTYDLDYCYNATTREVRTPIGINKDASPVGKLVDAIFDAPATQAKLMDEVKTFKPGLEIRLPGLEFSDLGKNIDSEGYLHIP